MRPFSPDFGRVSGRMRQMLTTGRCLLLLGKPRAHLVAVGAWLISRAEALQEKIFKPEHLKVERFSARYF